MYFLFSFEFHVCGFTSMVKIRNIRGKCDACRTMVNIWLLTTVSLKKRNDVYFGVT